MFLKLSNSQAEMLRAMLAAYDRGQREFPIEAPPAVQAAPPLRLVHTETDWIVGHDGTASYQSGIVQATVLNAGTSDDDPDVRLSAQQAITAVSGSTVTITAAAGRVIVGSIVCLTGCGSDDGEHAVTAVTTSGSSLLLTLSPDLTVTSPGGSVILPEAWGWEKSDAVNTVVGRADHRVIVVGRIGHEWHVLGSPAVWVLLDEGLSRATAASGEITLSSADATVLELNDDQTKLSESDRTLKVCTFDESLSLAAGTLCLARLIGAKWHVIWASCNVSGLRT